MHPFSLSNTQQEQVTGGLNGEVITNQWMCETGGPIRVTMAIPEDGNDPLPPIYPVKDIM
ncbi:hypothetical protein L1285_19165 [Pseudoalteromonas sp. DL2-H2.2]|uniref:Uncharacterized protein n=2 Tax=Pseudoalteromonas rubra TaxID=43658 RepID=A0A0F4QFT3_9GAMM|nr:hypothetical protein [Pseudoalteromonas sp. DL2-H2.2]KJZ06441.1 hypothetical protein TW77_19390 [Pseudoalteromonas rubra]MCF2910436.1 hypothetical protein [Pseudoalteromonas sp. DL2-H2.2]